MKLAKTKKLTAILAALIVMASVSTTAFAAQPSVPADENLPTAVLPASSYTIIAGAASGGQMSPEGTVSANYGESKTFTITPNAGYAINEVVVDGSRKGAIGSYTFSNISGNHSIVASFRPASESTYTTNLLKTDTRSYQMSPGNVYGARISVEGAKFNQGNVKVYSSRDHIASVTRVSDDVYQIRALQPGTTYVMAEAGNTHASIRIDVINGVQQSGEACRSVSVIEGTPQQYQTPTYTPTYTPPTQTIPTTPNVTTPSTGNYIGEARARQIATNAAGVSNPTFIKTQMDYENGRVVYEVEFYSGNREYDYEIDAITGAILKYDFDIENFTIPNTGTSTPSAGDIGLARAKQIALSHAGISASRAYFTKAKMDYEHGVRVYEIEFNVGRMEYEYEINAANGQILKFDRDYD